MSNSALHMLCNVHTGHANEWTTRTSYTVHTITTHFLYFFVLNKHFQNFKPEIDTTRLLLGEVVHEVIDMFE